jgi:hypothetical protein
MLATLVLAAVPSGQAKPVDANPVKLAGFTDSHIAEVADNPHPFGGNHPPGNDGQTNP